MRLFGLCCIVLLAAAILPSHAQYDAPIAQNPDRVVMNIHEDGRISAAFSPAHEIIGGPFVWLIPINGDILTAEILRPDESWEYPEYQNVQALRVLQAVTEVIGYDPVAMCSELFPLMVIGHMGPPYEEITVAKAEAVEIIQGGVLPNTLADWPLTSDQRADLADSDSGYVVVLYAAQEQAGLLEPVLITYQSAEIRVPLSAFPAREKRETLFWLFGPDAYQAENFATEQVDFTHFDTQHQVSHIGAGFPTWTFVDFQNHYTKALSELATAHDGRAVVREMTLPAESIAEGRARTVSFRIEDAADYPLLARLVDGADHETRLYAPKPPDEDISFMPDAAAEIRSNHVQLDDWVDPLAYWGCSSRTQPSFADSDALPETSTHLPDLRLNVHHPAGWGLSEFTVESGGDLAALSDYRQRLGTRQEGEPPTESVTRRVVVLSPEVVTAQTLHDYYVGQPTPPMFVAAPIDYYLEGMSQSAPLKFLLTGEYESETAPLTRRRYDPEPTAPTGSVTDSVAASGVAFGILTTPEDATANQTLYQAMLNQAALFRYYASPDFAHTLFLNGPRSFKEDIFLIMIPYPEGWIEQTLESGVIRIGPAGSMTAEGVFLTPLGRILGDVNYWDTPEIIPQTIGAWLIKNADAPAGIIETLEAWDKCDFDYPTYENATGTVQIMSGYVIEYRHTPEIATASIIQREPWGCEEE